MHNTTILPHASKAARAAFSLAGRACFVTLALLGGAARAQPAAPPDPLWMRYPAISPDGRQIAFAYQGGLWLVPTAGGSARPLVANGAYAVQPVWSPDGSQIAYASDLHGNQDIFIVPAEGGPSRRLTTHSANELPIAFTPDGKEVLFSAQRLDARSSLAFPARPMTELYKVATEPGRRPVQLFSSPAMAGRFDKAGARLVYEDWKGYENDWRKHHVSPVARDIWLWDAKTRQHRKLTSYGGEDRNPVWSPDEQSVYYLSEKSGSFNVWKMPLARPEAAEQVTRFAKHPVRFLSIAGDGTLSFGFDGELYTLAPGAREPQKLRVKMAGDTRSARIESRTETRGASELAVSPDGQELAFVLRGDVYVTSVEFGDTRRITSTPEQERSVSFSPDGRKLLFAGEREGSWNLYEASLPADRKAVPHFFNSAQVTIKTLLKNGRENFQPRYSPDGLEVAYLEDRVTVKVLNLASGQTRTVLGAEWNYSYLDGDQWFDWSPDSRWLLVQYLDRERWSTEVGLIDAAGKGPLVNLTKSGYDDVHPLWAQGGQALIWATDRMGLRGTSSNAQQDAFVMYLTREAYDRSRMDKAEYAQQMKRDEDDKKAAEEAKKAASAPDPKKADTKKPAKPEAKAGEPAPAEPLKFELDGVEDRVARLTPNSGNLRAMLLAPDGETAYFLLQGADAYELWVNRMRAGELRRAAAFPAAKPERFDPDPADLLLDAKGETVFLLVDGGIQKFKLPKGGEGDIKLEPVKFAAEQQLDRAGERAYFFEHAWRQMRDKLYAKDMNGVDWDGYKRSYERFLPQIGNGFDFAEMLSELLGELNVSHTGASYRPRVPGGDSTAALGAFFDDSHAGAGLKLAEVIEGGPLALAKSALKPGMVIEKIDGVAIAPGAEFDSPLNHKAGKRIGIAILDPASGKRFEEVVKPIAQSEQAELLYRRWIKREREAVDKLSGGRIGYVHVRGMDEPSYREVFSELLGRHSAKQAVVVDTRFNGGGDLHDELVSLLSGQRYLEYVPRGPARGWEPVRRWTKPSAVLISESNYSDAHLFPWLYKHRQLGKLVGMPVAGTGTAVWWEQLQDPAMVFGIPEIGFRDAQGRLMETERVDPDITVPADPLQLEAGRDEQLEAAVKALLQP